MNCLDLPDQFAHTIQYNTIQYASRLWNALPGRIRAADTVEKFKKDVKTLLFNGHGELKRRAFKYCL